MLKEFIKPDKKKYLLTLFIIIFAIGLIFLMFFIGIPIPKGFEILKIIGLPLQLTSLIGFTSIFFLPLLFITIFWIYLLACILSYLGKKIFTTEWDAKKIIILCVIIILCIAAYGYFNLGWGDILIPTADDSGATIQGVNEVVNANNQFAIELYGVISNETNENIFFSPWSISTVVAMAYEGARGETAREIQGVFHFPEDEMTRRASYAKVLNMINKASGKYKLHTANAIWLQEDYPFLKDYKDTISRYYLGEIKNLDFANDPGGSSSYISNWVSRNTGNKIKDIVFPGMFTESTRAVLTDAIYFKGEWKHPFNEENTEPENFTMESGEKIIVPMMRLTDDDLRFNYAESDGVQVLELPYLGDKISMLVLLPRTGIANHLESMLSAEKLQEWRSEMRPRTVNLHMPKYTFETSYSLNDYLKSMGMGLPFTWPGADFSGMDGTENLYIDNILHKAYVAVDEKGTEATATTSLLGGIGAAVPHYIDFIADHPFIFIIQQRETGNILFMGRVDDPTK